MFTPGPVGCIDDLITDNLRAKGIHCPCDKCEAEWEKHHPPNHPSEAANVKRKIRDGKMLAAGDEDE